MFRKTLLSAATVAAMMSAVPAFAAPNDVIPTKDAGHGTIQFTGSVIDAPCNIPPDSQNIQVNLGQVNKKTLAAIGNYSSAVPVTINLTGCSFTEGSTSTVPLSKVGVSFPDAVAPSNGSLDEGEIAINATDDAATNVAIQFLKSDGSKMPILTGTPTAGDIQLDTGSSTNKLSFYARMIAVGGGATPGSVGATVTYKLHYF